jgi:DNA-binding NarL/FixJ family response regulator
LQPDIVLLDIDMPGMAAFDAARTIRLRSPRTRLAFVSAHFHDRYIEQALGVGAMGYITKGEPPETVARAIRSIAGGGAYFSPDVQARIVIDVSGPRLADQQRTRVSILTAREQEVLRYLASGLAKKEIAETMNLSVGTVNNHAANLMKKLDIHDRVELTRFAIREGIVTT